MRICELRQKEVINICDGRRLGYITDVDLDVKNGCVRAYIIPGPARIWGCIGRDSEYIIPIQCVKQMGDDTILVEVNPDDILKKCKI